MVNSDKFATRLKKIMDYYDLSASSFADKIEVGRSSISHLLSGRNKPSLDFVMKVLHTFPEINLYWLMNGKGYFIHENDSTTPFKPLAIDYKKNTDAAAHTMRGHTSTPSANAKEIKRIIILYKDGSFESFENNP